MLSIAHDLQRNAAKDNISHRMSQASILLSAAFYHSAHFLSFFSRSLLALSYPCTMWVFSSIAHGCYFSANPLSLSLFHFYSLPRSHFRSHSLQDAFLMYLPALQVRCVSSVHLDHPSSLPPLALMGGAAGSPAAHQWLPEGRTCLTQHNIHLLLQEQLFS